MLDTKDFNFFESQNSFDFKGFLLKIVGYWKWFAGNLASGGAAGAASLAFVCSKIAIASLVSKSVVCVLGF